MFSFFLSHSVCDWHTSNIGKPLLSRAAGQYIVTATDAGFVALLNESDGELFWRSKLSGVNYLEMRENSPATVALLKHYFVVIDNETGVQTAQVPHSVKKAYAASFANKTVVVVGPKKMALYNISHEIWSREIDHEEKTDIRFTDDGSRINFAGKAYNPENGEVFGYSEEENNKKVSEEIDFRYQPTVLEYFKNGQFVWRIDEPFYGSELVGVISFDFCLFKNESGLIVLNLNKGAVEKFMPMSVKNAVIYKDFTYIKNQEGEFELDNKELKLSSVTNKIKYAKLSGRSISTGLITSTMPKNGEVKCVLQSPSEGSIFVVHQSKDELDALVISEDGRIVTNAFIKDSLFGHCWQTQDSFHISYIKSNGNTYINSFSQNISAQRSWETDDLMISSSEHYALLANGKLVNIPTNQLSATMPMPEGEVGVGGFMDTFKTMMSGTITAGPPFYEPHLHGVNAEHNMYGYSFISDAYSRVVMKGVDVYLLGEQVIDRTIQIIIVVLFACAVIYMGIKHYTAKKTSFWK